MGFLIALATLVFATTSAYAHTGYAHTGFGGTSGFSYGFLHPLAGLDHILAMVGVGLFAALLGGRALWLVPACFVVVMAFAAGLGAAGLVVASPLVGLGVSLSIIAIGAALALGRNMSVPAAMAFVGSFAIFHGLVHGSEMPASISGISYGGGFLVATALLHAAGISLGYACAGSFRTFVPRLAQIAGGAISLAGGGILVGLIAPPI